MKFQAKAPVAPEAALEQQRRAVRNNPLDAQAHANLGITLQLVGQFETAVASQRRALELDPGLVKLHALLAPALVVLGQHEAAIDSYRCAIDNEPNNGKLHQGLCNALRACGQFQAAAASGERAVALTPSDADFHVSLGAALHGLGELDSAVASFRKALDMKPGDLDAQVNLAVSLHSLARFDEAAAAYRAVLALRPDHFDAHANLATVLKLTGQYGAAHTSLQRALALRPDHLPARRESGVILSRLNRHEEALAVRLALLVEHPDDVDVLLDVALSQQLCGQSSLARATFERALERDPDNTGVHTMLGFYLIEVGESEAGLRHVRRAHELLPDSAAAFSNMLFLLSHTTNDPRELTDAHFQFAERFEAPLRAGWQAHANSRDPERVLKVGFVSADLNNHAVASFIDPIFEFLTHSPHVSLHVYYNNTIDDAITQRLRTYVSQWRLIGALNDDAAERLIRADGIDILVDLSGHTALNRLTLFARKPAPIQASWIGYAGTTGLTAVDYYIADGFYLPEGKYDDQFSEKIVRLPLGAAFLPSPHAPPVNPLPALTNGYLTFGSFNRSNKLSRAVITLWAGLLRRVPDAKFVLGGLQRGLESKVLAWFAEEGIAPERLILQPRGSLSDFLAHHHQVDICLTPLPYAGGTTMCHGLWMGVPVLTTVGPTNPSHTSVCYMAHLGLTSFVADSDENYFKLGEFLSQNLGELAELRAGMRDRFNASAAGYPVIAASGLERALRLMWLRWCEGLPPEPIRVRLADLMNDAEPEDGQ